MIKFVGAMILSVMIFAGISTITAQQTESGKSKATASNQSEEKFLAKGDGVESCPVSGEKLESKEIKAEFFGRTVYFCCNDCLAAAKKNPELYIKKTEAEQIEAVKKMSAKSDGHDHHGTEAKATTFLGKGDGETTCPVTGEPIDKNIKTEIMGRTVYACCPGCLASIKKSPELYLKWVAEKEKQ